METRKIRIAQIGTMHDHAPAIFGDLLKQTDIFDVAGYATVRDDEYENLVPWMKEMYDKKPRLTVEEILSRDDIEAVTIETAEVDATYYATLAAKAGKHIHMDKPGGISGKEFDALIDLLEEKKLVFSTGYMYRHNPAVKRVLEMKEKGELGDIYAVEVHMDCLHTDEKRDWLGQFPGGMLFFLGCHLIDMIYLFMGTPEEVIPLSVSTGKNGVKALDYGMTVLKYKNGVSFAKTCAAEPGGYARRQLVVCGTKGTVELKPFEMGWPGRTDGAQYTGMNVVPEETAFKKGWDYMAEVEKVGPVDRYSGMMQAFASYVRGEKENPFTYEYERGLHALLLKCCGYTGE